MSNQSRIRPWAILLLAGIVWGTTFSLAREATSEGAHPLAINLCITVLAVALLWTMTLARRRRLPLSRQHLLFYVIAGVLGTVLPATLYFYAASRVSAGVLSISIGIVPILTFIFALGLDVDRLALSRVLGVAAGSLSIALLVLPEQSLANPGATGWVLVALLANACYAVENVYISVRLPRGLDAITALCGMQSVAAMLLVPLTLLNDVDLPLLSSDWTSVQWCIVAMALITVACYAMFIHLIDTAGPVFASQMAYVVTLSGVVWGIVFFSESHSSWVWLSLSAMLVGIALVKPRSTGDTRSAPETGTSH